MEVLDNSENKRSDINLNDFPFICRICLRRGDLKLFEEEDHLLNLFVTITNIHVRSTVNFPRNICQECINILGDISLFVDISKYNDPGMDKNFIVNEENKYLVKVESGTSQEHEVKTEKTEQCQEDIYNEGYEMCLICSSTSGLKPFEEKASLLQLYEHITNIDVQAESKFSRKHCICIKCTATLEKTLQFLTLSLYNDMKLENAIRKNEASRSEDGLRKSESDVGLSKCIDMKVESADRNEVQMENDFDENESKDVIDIKEEILYRPESSVSQIPVHTREKAFKCDCCEKSFTTKYYLKSHSLIHTGGAQFRCDQCEKSFTNKYYVKIHLLTHTEKKPFKCDCCEKSFATRQVLKCHLLTHTGEKPFKCDCCEKSFTTRCYLKSHLLTHTGQAPFKCERCGKKITTKQGLKSHLLTHTEEKAFKCDCCKKSFRHRGNLGRHLLTHTRKKPYKCGCCEKSYRQKSNLNKHLLSHNGKQPFKCVRCKMSFKTEYFLKCHLVNHTGEAPFECDYCKKSFTTKYYLKCHLLTHTGKTPFKCDYCKKNFSQKSNLKSHLLIHTRKKSYKNKL